MSTQPRSEEALAEAARSGDAGAFDALFRRCYGPVFSLCRRMTGRDAEAHDLAQETFLKALRSIGLYDPARPVSRWLLKIAANLAIDSIRRKEKEPAASDAADEPAGPGEAFDVADLDRIRGAVLKLPSTHRAVVLLNFQQGYSHEEIADALDITVTLSRVRLHRAIRMLRELLS